MEQSARCRNITISGGVATGTTTLTQLIKGQPLFTDWRFFSGGEFMRAYAQENGYFSEDAAVHHDARVYSEDFDRTVDFGMRERLEQREHQVFEAWLAGFFAQRISGVLKILLICSDDAVLVDRIANRDGISVEEAKHHLQEREHENFARWARMYAAQWREWVGERPINFWDTLLYDLVIDTYSNSKEETLDLVIKKYTYG